MRPVIMRCWRGVRCHALALQGVGHQGGLGAEVDAPVADVEDGEEDGEHCQEKQILSGRLNFVLQC